MNLLEAAYERHVVRHFDSQPLKQEHQNELNNLIDSLNKKYGLHMQLMINEPLAFGGEKAKWSNITGCVNYLVIIAKPTHENKVLAGYVGEQIVLKAQSMGINSCWAALTYDKQEQLYKYNANEELIIVVALGYGLTQGKPHPCKSFEQVCINKTNLPKWFIDGVNCALSAPTGKNQQGFTFELLDDDSVVLINNSFCNEADYGILKYHFELGADDYPFKWYEKK